MLRNRRMASYPEEVLLPLHSYEEKPKGRPRHYKWYMLLTLLLVVLLGSGGIVYLATSKRKFSHHMDNSEIPEAARVMEERVMLVQAECLKQTVNNDHHGIYEYKNMLYNKSRKIFYCPVFKTASTNWVVHFLTLSGIQKTSLKKKSALALYEKAKFISHPPTFPDNIALKRDNSVTKIITVRHPFERLLSAYRAVFETKTSIFTAYQHTALSIIQQYHNPKSQKSLDRIHPAFDEFIRFIIYKTDLEDDPYWAPYYEYCIPCDVNYNYIIKSETSTHDQKFLFNQLQLDMLQPLKRNVNPRGKTSLDVAKHYFSGITTGDLKLLQAKYDLDFKLFGYSPYPYLNFTKWGDAIPPMNYDIRKFNKRRDEKDEEEREEKEDSEYEQMKNGKQENKQSDNTGYANGQEDDSEGHTTQDVDDEHSTGQDTKEEQNFFQDIPSKQNIVQDSEGNYVIHESKILGSTRDVVQDATGEQNVVQEMTEQHNVVPNKMDEQNVVWDTMGDQNVGQDTMGEQNVGQDTMGEQNVGQDTMGEQNVGQDTMGEQNVGQNTIGEQNVGQHRMGEQNVAQNTMSEHKLGHDTMSEQKLGQDTMSEQNVAQDTMSEQNVGQDKIGEQNPDQDTMNEMNAAPDRMGEQNVVHEMASQHDVIRENKFEQGADHNTDYEQAHNQEDTKDEHMTIDTDDSYNGIRKGDEEQNKLQDNEDNIDFVH